MMKKHLTLILYCVLFSVLFMSFYAFISKDSSYEVTRRDSGSDLEQLRSGDYSKALRAGARGSRRKSDSSSQNEDDGDLVRLTDLALPRGPIRQGCPKIPKPLLKYVPLNHSDPLTHREKVLAMCKQRRPISMDKFFTETMRATLTKIGEGAFADVFGCQKEGWDKLAVKIIPVEGDLKYNDELQNTFESIQTEMVVSIELSLLGEEDRRKDPNILHYTKNFMQIERVSVCQGKFPEFMLEAWDDYDFRKKSDNDRPSVFAGDQLYIMYSAENSGIQLGGYVYHSYEEAISILQQISATVGVGEAALQFEHRDMHRGNVLVRRTHQEYIYFRLDGVEYSIKSYGVMATIVDYTLSRVKQEGTDCTSYFDLGKTPWLFKGKGDIQFDVYRNIRNHTGGNWEGFYPRTNVLWLNYLATKTSIKAKLKKLSYRTWKAVLKPFLDLIPEQESGKDVFLNVFSPKAVKRLRTNISSHHTH